MRSHAEQIAPQKPNKFIKSAINFWFVTKVTTCFAIYFL